MSAAAAQTTLDRVISYFSPERGARRLQARMQISAAGGYIGAKSNRRSLFGFQPTGRSADAAILPDLPALRNRSHDMVRNEPLAAGAINTVTTNVVGPGLRVQSQIDREFLGLNDNEADAWERNAERVFSLWANSRECDLSRKLNFNQMQDVAFRSFLEAGDAFAVFRFRERAGSPFGVKTQLIESERCSNPNNGRDTARLKGGISFDEDGAPVSYHFQATHPNDIGSPRRVWADVPAFGDSGRPNVLHLFRPTRPDQARGVPYLAAVIEPLKQLGDYKTAELEAAVISACFTVFVKTEDRQGMQQAPASDGSDHHDEDSIQRFPTGAVLDLKPGESIDIADPKRPNDRFDPFVLAILRQIGVALELPFEILVKHFTASYSAARAALLEAWKMYRTRRVWFAAGYCQPHYEAVLIEAVARGMLDAPGFFDDPLLFAAYCGSVWIGPAPGQIDEQRETNAAIARADAGLSTLQEETAKITGGDWERNHAQRVKEMRKRREDGLESAAPAASSAAPPTDPDADANDNDREEATNASA